MESSLAALFFVGLVLVFSSAATHDDFNILTSEGNYKHGSMKKMWIPILNRMEIYTKPAGHEIIENIKEHVEPLEIAFQVKDDATLSLIFAEIGPLYKDLVPYITNESLAKASFTAGSACEEVAEKLKTTGMTLEDLAIFEKDAAILITSAME